MTSLMTVNIISRKQMIPGDSGKFEHKGADKTKKKKRTCTFYAKIFHENKYLSTI